MSGEGSGPPGGADVGAAGGGSAGPGRRATTSTGREARVPGPIGRAERVQRRKARAFHTDRTPRVATEHPSQPCRTRAAAEGGRRLHGPNAGHLAGTPTPAGPNAPGDGRCTHSGRTERRPPRQDTHSGRTERRPVRWCTHSGRAERTWGWTVHPFRTLRTPRAGPGTAFRPDRASMAPRVRAFRPGRHLGRLQVHPLRPPERLLARPAPPSGARTPSIERARYPGPSSPARTKGTDNRRSVRVRSRCAPKAPLPAQVPPRRSSLTRAIVERSSQEPDVAGGARRVRP